MQLQCSSVWAVQGGGGLGRAQQGQPQQGRQTDSRHRLTDRGGGEGRKLIPWGGGARRIGWGIGRGGWTWVEG